MQLLHGNPWPELFGKCEHEAFHLEVRDEYGVSGESEPFRRFINAEPADNTWFEPWGRLVRSTTDRGVHVTRLRVVTVPHVEYQRWLLTLAALNTEAGEEIRYLPRHGARDVPSDDFWLLDNQWVAFNLVDENGRAAGASALTTDPKIADQCRHVKERLWELATPYDEYIQR